MHLESILDLSLFELIFLLLDVILVPLGHVTLAISAIRQVRFDVTKLAGPITSPIGAADFELAD